MLRGNEGCSKTKIALFWMNLSAEPMVALYSLLPFILRKDAGATLFQISIFIMVRPLLSVFSFYWVRRLTSKREDLLPYLTTTWLFAYVPLLFLPFSRSYLFFLFVVSLYQLFSKASTPALIEILKRKIPKQPRDTLFSASYIFSFIEGGVLALAIGRILDLYPGSWRLLCFLASGVALSSLFAQRKIEIPVQLPECSSFKKEDPTLSGTLGWILPWKESFALLRARPDFAHFQWSFMLGGAALMMMTPALAVYYADILQVSHTDITVARFIFMAIGVALSSFFWKKGLARGKIDHFNSLVLIGFALFPLTLFLAKIHPFFLNWAFLIYGIAQAGSHLIWNLSGTVFALEQDSAPFTAVNLCMIGIRGIVAPLAGGLLCHLFGPIFVLILGTGVALFGSWYAYAKRPQAMEVVS